MGEDPFEKYLRESEPDRVHKAYILVISQLSRYRNLAKTIKF